MQPENRAKKITTRPITDEQVKKIIHAYQAGGSIRQAAKAAEVSYGTAHRYLTENGVKMRTRDDYTYTNGQVRLKEQPAE